MRIRLALLLILPLFTCSDTVCAQSRRPAPEPQRAYKAKRILAAFRTGSERDRLIELMMADRNRQAPRLAFSLSNAIGLDLTKKHLARSTLEAVRIFCSLDDDDLEPQQLEFVQSSTTPVAVVAAGAVAKRGLSEAFEPLVQLAARPEYAESYGMRHVILEAVARYARPEAIDFLIGAHVKHTGQLRYEAARHLRRLTGQNFGGYPDRWEDWWRANRATFEFAAPTKGADHAEMPWPGTVPKFFKVPIYADRVMFVIDHSRSMLSTVDGVTRMQEVQEELQQVFKDLRPEVRFNVLAYNEALTQWSNGNAVANLANRMSATQFVFSLTPDLKTSFYDAVDRALDYRHNLELIVVLTDGKPTSGRVVDRAEIIRLVTAKNQFARVSVTALGVDLSPSERQFLEELTARNFGDLQEIR